MHKIIISHLALFLANIIYAVNYIVAKDVMPNYITPKGFIFLRIFGAFCVFFLIHKIFIKEHVGRKDFLHLFICAIFGVFINMLCFFEGLSITTPINASLIMITTPVIVYLISVFVFKKERNIIRLLGVVSGLLGAGLLITNGGGFVHYNSFGDVLILINAASYAVYLVLVKSLMNKYHPVTVLKNLFFMGFIMIAPIGWREAIESSFIYMPADIIFKLLFVIFFTTCIAYFLNIYAISRLRASTVAFYIYLQPLLATFLAIALGKDILTINKLVSSIFIFLGVYFVIQRT